MEATVNCPFCGETLSIHCSVSSENGVDKVRMRVHQAVQKFLMWNLFDRPKYGEQRKYNPDYEYVEFVMEDRKRMAGYFKFRIQTFGSSEGDEWLEGKVKVSGSKIRWETLEFRYVGI